ncbi:hypothetical protein NQ317_010400 [Molorchus minor]|uniref:Reverse transcriptase n=1 Tax=Molorchus minor TaxID=1323400 RepID=A0ABQ9ISC5_9CUCU|nr:hypothetical protein NQ317_010400 [Molorchus minor]
MAHGFRDKALLRVISGYRTISASATKVVAEILPIDLLTNERRRLYEREDGGTPNSERRKERQAWRDGRPSGQRQRKWPSGQKYLYPIVIDRHRHTDYFITQILTGHGSFKVYTHRIGKVAEERCAYCEHKDTVAHTMFECNRWEIDRQRVKNVEVGVLLNENNLIEEMIESIEKWTSIKKYIGRVMKLKEAEERDMQRIDIRRAQHLNP